MLQHIFVIEFLRITSTRSESKKKRLGTNLTSPSDTESANGGTVTILDSSKRQAEDRKYLTCLQQTD